LARRTGEVPRVKQVHPSEPPSRLSRTAATTDALNALRLLAASCVVIDHCMPLTGTSRSILPDWTCTSLGTVAVIAFFALSGYQVTDSWARDPSLWRWSARRVLRIWPPLVAVLLVSALVLGPIFTTLPLRGYFSSQQTLGYVVQNTGLFAATYQLPGVFESNPYPGAPINGSLWTLAMEVSAYALVPLLVVFGARVARTSSVVVLAGFAGMTIVLGLPGVPPRSLVEVPLLPMATFVTAFILGHVVYLHGVGRATRWPLLVVALAAYAVALLCPGSSTTAPVVLCFLVGGTVLWASHHWPRVLTGSAVWTGVSYGVYLWGFPVTQALIAVGVGAPALLALLALPLTLAAGWVSWVLVERPTAELKRYLRPRTLRPPPAYNPDPPTIPLRVPRQGSPESDGAPTVTTSDPVRA
jgi:peptidoglycan/LPS O-acetylase OafA/YrhL